MIVDPKAQPVTKAIGARYASGAWQMVAIQEMRSGKIPQLKLQPSTARGVRRAQPRVLGPRLEDVRGERRHLRGEPGRRPDEQAHRGGAQGPGRHRPRPAAAHRRPGRVRLRQHRGRAEAVRQGDRDAPVPGRPARDRRSLLPRHLPHPEGPEGARGRRREDRAGHGRRGEEGRRGRRRAGRHRGGEEVRGRVRQARHRAQGGVDGERLQPGRPRDGQGRRHGEGGRGRVGRHVPRVGRPLREVRRRQQDQPRRAQRPLQRRHRPRQGQGRRRRPSRSASSS